MHFFHKVVLFLPSMNITVFQFRNRQSFTFTVINVYVFCQQEVDYHIIENLVHGFWFVVEFHLEHLSDEVEQFVGNVCVEPKGLPVGEKCPINKKFNLGITEDFELKVSNIL